MRISDWSSDVCSSDLAVRCRLGHLFAAWTGREQSPCSNCGQFHQGRAAGRSALSGDAWPAAMGCARNRVHLALRGADLWRRLRHLVRGAARSCGNTGGERPAQRRSEGHTSDIQSIMRISYAVFCLKKKKNNYMHYKQNTSNYTM